MVETLPAMIFTVPTQSLFSLTVVMYSSVYIVQNLKISNFGTLTSGRSASQSIYYFISRLLPLSCICVTQISESCCVMFTMTTEFFQFEPFSATLLSVCLSHDAGRRILSSIFTWHARTAAMCLGLTSSPPFTILSTTSPTSLCWAVTQVCRTSDLIQQAYCLSLHFFFGVRTFSHIFLIWDTYRWAQTGISVKPGWFSVWKKPHLHFLILGNIANSSEIWSECKHWINVLRLSVQQLYFWTSCGRLFKRKNRKSCTAVRLLTWFSDICRMLTVSSLSEAERTLQFKSL